MWKTEEQLEFELEQKYSYTEIDKIMYQLHGACDLWVKRHYKPGDKIGTWLCENEVFDGYFLVHTFIIRNNEFLDLRGNTPNMEDMAEGFWDWLYDPYEQLIVSENLRDWRVNVLKPLGLE